MQLDDLKAAWAAHGAALERSLAIDERLLRETFARKTRLALAPYVLVRGLEAALGLAALGAIVSVLARHAAEPRYLVVGGALAAFAVATVAQCVHLLVLGLRLDHGGPVAALQRDVERMKLAEYRAFKWALLGGIVAWLPALLVLFEAATGVDALARVDLGYLLANLGLGLAVLALGQAWSRRYVERDDLSPFARRVVDALSGRSLRVAKTHLDELASFVRE